MDFNATDVQLAWKQKGETLGRDLALDAAAADVVMGAARVGLLDPDADLLSLTFAVEALAFQSPSAAIAFALHMGTALALVRDERFSTLFRGEAVGALALSSDEYPALAGDRLTGRAAWVAPITDRGVALVGGRAGDELTAAVVALDARGVSVQPVDTAALRGFVCGHLTFEDAPCVPVGPTVPVMARLRVLVAAAGLGMGRRALREAVDTAKRTRAAAAWEETVQGLLADAATELDAAMMLTWKAAVDLPPEGGSHDGGSHSLSPEGGSHDGGSHSLSPEGGRHDGGSQHGGSHDRGSHRHRAPALGAASLAKLAAGAAAQHAIDRATQVIGADAFQRGHIVERLAQDVRALELFAGRTEALRAAAAAELLPTPSRA